jgi:NAD(P)H-flavin reductase
MQSNPDESNIRITYSVKGCFTRLMESYLKPDSEVWLKMPYGDLFSRPHNRTNTVFIAGGTGVTPFLSLFTHEYFRNYINPRVYLGFKSRLHNIYSKYINENAFKILYEDFDGILNINKIFSENGIDKDYFISGPPEMIKLFRAILVEYKVPSERILTDDWE